MDITPETVDPTNTDETYWNDILRRCGLSMRRGERPNLVEYRGGAADIGREVEKIEAARLGIKTHGSKPS